MNYWATFSQQGLMSKQLCLQCHHAVS